MSSKFWTAIACAVLFALPASAQRGPNRGGDAPTQAQPAPAQGAQPQSGQPQQGPDRSAAAITSQYPRDVTTQHSIALPAGPLNFTATAGSIRLSNAQTGQPTVDIAYIAYQKPDADTKTRPVTFLFNGGPGYASGWLNLGVGPWRLPMAGDATAPSTQPVLLDNAETWLDFTDLVFIDPPGTGYGRILGNDDIRKRLWSVQGDLDVLATTIRRWVEQNNRGLSPKFVGGESYGGFRTPKITHMLQTDQGVGVNGMIMLSPVLDFGRFNLQSGLWDLVARLPAYAATAREKKAPVTRQDMLDVEQYAQGEFLADLLKGPRDLAAVARLTTKFAELTGIDPLIVKRYGARLGMETFAREINGESGRVSSLYDARETGFDPYPNSFRNNGDDQLRLGLHAPITQAMVDLYHNRLKWVVENGRYQFQNEQAGRQWDWGNRGSVEAVRDLRQSLALDPKLRVLVGHGLTDLVTPYFETKMVLDQIPAYGSADRLRFEVYPGGHMFYSRDDSRKKFRDDVRGLIEGK